MAQPTTVRDVPRPRNDVLAAGSYSIQSLSRFWFLCFPHLTFKNPCNAYALQDPIEVGRDLGIDAWKQRTHCRCEQARHPRLASFTLLLGFRVELLALVCGVRALSFNLGFKGTTSLPAPLLPFPHWLALTPTPKPYNLLLFDLFEPLHRLRPFLRAPCGGIGLSTLFCHIVIDMFQEPETLCCKLQYRSDLVCIPCCLMRPHPELETDILSGWTGKHLFRLRRWPALQ